MQKQKTPIISISKMLEKDIQAKNLTDDKTLLEIDKILDMDFTGDYNTDMNATSDKYIHGSVLSVYCKNDKEMSLTDILGNLIDRI